MVPKLRRDLVYFTWTCIFACVYVYVHMYVWASLTTD